MPILACLLTCAPTLALAPPAAVPISFEPNLGQAGPGPAFLARTAGFTLALSPDGVSILRPAPGRAQPLRLEVLGARLDDCRGEGPLARRSHFLLGDDPARWITDVPHYSRVVCRDAYPGIDLVFHAASGGLEYDLVAAPGADLEAIALRFHGAERLELEATGDLLVHVEDGVLRHRKPIVYHAGEDADRRPVGCEYALEGEDGGCLIRFRLGEHDLHVPLVIDPILVFSSLLGTSQGDLIQAVAADRFGNTYVTGFTAGADFPVENPLQSRPGLAGAVTAFVTKFSPTGREVLWSTYLGGKGTSRGEAISFSKAGNPLVAGSTDAADFPRRNAFQQGPGGGFDAFLTELAPAGNAVVSSTTWGGKEDDRGEAMALDKAGVVYLAGETESLALPVVAPSDETLGGTSDAFVLKVKETLGGVLFATYLGGGKAETARGVAADTKGNFYVTGETRSTDFPLKGAMQGTLRGPTDAFVACFRPDGQAFIYSTYLGGAGTDDGWAIAADADGHAYVTGRASGGFPLKNSLFDPLGNTLLFAAKFLPNGADTVFATLLATNVSGIPQAIALTPARDIYIGGSIVYLGDGFSIVPSRGPPLQRTYGGGASDGFLYRLDSTGTFFRYASFLGGSQGEEVTSIALGEREEVYAAGLTASADFPRTFGAFDASHNGQNDGFVARVDTFQYPDDPPYLALGQPLNFAFTAAARSRRLRVVVPPGLRAIITLTDTDPLDANVLYARHGGEARPYLFDHAAEERGRASQRLVIPETQAGELYLFIQATVMNGGASAVSLTAEAVDFALERLTPARAAAGSRFHAAVEGAGFRSDAFFTIARQSGGPTLNAQEVLVTSPTHAEMVFDLTGQPPGVYRLKGGIPERSSGGLENALQVTPAGVPADLEARLSAGDACRFNRPARITLHYQNAGDEELPAPVLRLRAPAGVELRLEDEATFRGNTLDLLGVNPDGPAGFLAPGAGGSIAVVFRSTVEGAIDFTLEALTPNGGDLISWSTLAPPIGFPAAEWNALRSPLGAVLGGTWAEYQEALGEVATRLLRRGLGGAKVLSARELFRRAVLEAKGTFPGAAVAGRVLYSAPNSPLARAVVLALEGGQVRSSAVTDGEGRFALECLAAGATYDLRVPAHDVGSARVLLPAGGADVLAIELRAITGSNAPVAAPSICDGYVLPGRGLEAPSALFTPYSTFTVDVLRSHDPNEKDGPEGEGPKKHIGVGDELVYTIHFENTGNAPAQVVGVSDSLDPNLDWSTFRLLEAGVGNHIFSLDAIPGGTSQIRQGYSASRIEPAVRTGTPFSAVEARCEFDPLTGLLAWTFETLDPVTGSREPTSPADGFLPPNSPAPQGEGWVSFSIYPRQTLAEGTDIENDGSIVFDDPPEIITNRVFNVITHDLFTLRVPRNPSPANGTARPVEIPGLHLRWECDPRTETYEVRLWREGATKPAPPTAAGLVNAHYVPVLPLDEGETYRWQVTARAGARSATGPEWRFRTAAPPAPAVGFRRGDANADGRLDISDSLHVLGYLFLGGDPPACLDSGDSNDDGKVNISDPSALLGHLFLGTTPALPLPFRACGPDPTADELGCAAHGACP